MDIHKGFRSVVHLFVGAFPSIRDLCEHCMSIHLPDPLPLQKLIEQQKRNEIVGNENIRSISI